MWRLFSEKQEYCDRRFLFLFFAFWRNLEPQINFFLKNSIPNIGIVPSPTESFGHLKNLGRGFARQKLNLTVIERGFVQQKLDLTVIRKGVCLPKAQSRGY
jgi:hypothetical protein